MRTVWAPHARIAARGEISPRTVRRPDRYPQL